MADMDFDQWFARQGQVKHPAPREPVMVRCCRCGNRFEADYVDTEEEADGIEHYCNGSARCCP